ncbi:hypothetical protein M3J09_001766 [Ascochyta lentis]
MSFSSGHRPETSTKSGVESVAKGEPGARKVNSEARKQQNRIASRNYREKRKRKLQQLQQLLDEDVSSEQQAHTRSTSPCEDQSCSGSAEYGTSTANSSPHFTALSGNLASPSPDHTMVSDQAWSTIVASSATQPLHTDAYFETPQHTTAYDTSAYENYSTWNAPSYTTGTGYFMPDSFKYLTYPVNPSSWPPLWFERMYPYTEHQHGARNTWSYLPLPPCQSSEHSQDSVVSDPYGRRDHSHEPS